MLEKNNLPKVIVILGPTASGKSDLAVELALKFNGEVVSADSRQVYKGLNIGTGKITKKEMRGIPHHLLDVASPQKRFAVSDYLNLTNKTIVKIVKSGKLPIICGGTGFYIDALLGDKQIPEVQPDPKLRAELEEKSVEELFNILQKLDPERAENIDSKNPRRLVRAVEICKALGSVPKLVDSSKHLESRKYDTLKIGIKIEDEELKNRINLRLEKRMKKGMIAEAKKLHGNGLSYKKMRELGLEYQRLADFLERKISKQDTTSLLQKEIWQYAKRQITWFKKNKDITWFTSTQIKSIEDIVEKFLEN